MSYNEHCPARICLSAPLSVAGIGDAVLRHRGDGDGAGVPGGDEEGDR